MHQRIAGVASHDDRHDHHEHRDAQTLAQLQHGQGAVYHLRDASRGGLVFLIIEGLEGFLAYQQKEGKL